jgi:hypothetical protein
MGEPPARWGSRKGEGIYDPEVPGRPAEKSRRRTRPTSVLKPTLVVERGSSRTSGPRERIEGKSRCGRTTSSRRGPESTGGERAASTPRAGLNPSGEARRAPPVTGSSNQGPHDPSRGEPRAIPAGERSRGPDVAFARSSRARAVTRPAEARGHPIRAQALRSRQNHSATRRKLPPTWRRGRPTPVPPLKTSLP